MTAQVPAIGAPALPAPAPRRPHRRFTSVRRGSIILVAAAVLVAGAAAERETLAAIAHDLCTLGTPQGSTCGDALVRLGYP